MFLLLRERKQQNQRLPKPCDGSDQQKQGEAIAGLRAEWQGLTQCLNRFPLQMIAPFARRLPVFEQRRDVQMVAQMHIISLARTFTLNDCRGSRKKNLDVGPE